MYYSTIETLLLFLRIRGKDLDPFLLTFIYNLYGINGGAVPVSGDDLCRSFNT